MTDFWCPNCSICPARNTLCCVGQDGYAECEQHQQAKDPTMPEKTEEYPLNFQEAMEAVYANEIVRPENTMCGPDSELALNQHEEPAWNRGKGSLLSLSNSTIKAKYRIVPQWKECGHDEAMEALKRGDKVEAYCVAKWHGVYLQSDGAVLFRIPRSQTPTLPTNANRKWRYLPNSAEEKKDE